MNEEEVNEQIELRREANWLNITANRKFKACPSQKIHKRHVWNGPEPMKDGWYCMGYYGSELGRKPK